MALEKEFNKLAGKIISMAEYRRLIREAKARRYANNPLGKVFSVVSRVASTPVRAGKMIIATASGNTAAGDYYLDEAGVAVFEQYAERLRNAAEKEGKVASIASLGATLVVSFPSIIKTVLANGYTDGGALVSNWVKAQNPSIQDVEFTLNVLDKCKNHTKDVKSGKLIHFADALKILSNP